MRGSSKTDVRDDSPFLEQPFRHIKAILIVLTPVPERPRADITFFGESQTFRIHFELSRPAWNKCARLAPIRISSSTRHRLRSNHTLTPQRFKELDPYEI